jgi:phospholipid/cholesterol/gamma-HCH transport system substrate-binding protein
MKTDRFKAALLGVFVLTALALLIWFVLFLRPIVGDSGKELTIYSPTLDGIVIGTRVTYAGKPMGEVTAIETLSQPETRSGSSTIYVFRLEASVDSALRIYAHDRITLSTQGLLGEKSIAIFPQLPAEQEITTQPLYIETGDGVGGLFKQLESIRGKVEKALDQVSYFFEQNTEPARDTLLAVKETTMELKSALQRSDIAGTLKHLDDASLALEHLVVEVGRSDMLPKLSSTLSSFESITASIERGEGTLGQLLKNDCFSRQINNILCRFDLFLYDVNRFGILYHWNSTWKREQRYRLEAACCMEDLEPMRIALKDVEQKLHAIKKKRLEGETLNMIER